MENDLVLYSINAVRAMEVIDIASGSKLGYVKDFKVNIAEERVVSIIIPSPSKTWFSKEEDIEIPWEKVVRTGIDVLLVDCEDIDLNLNYNNM